MTKTEQKDRERRHLYWRLEETGKNMRYQTALLRDMSLRFDDTNSSGCLLMSALCDTIKSAVEETARLHQELDQLGQ